jgi:hypothetical protein
VSSFCGNGFEQTHVYHVQSTPPNRRGLLLYIASPDRRPVGLPIRWVEVSE